LRWFRAVVVAVVSVAGGVVGHVSAGGLLPEPKAMVCLGLVSVIAAVAMLGRPASTTRVVALLVVGQTLIHLVLTASAGHRGEPVQSPSVTSCTRDTIRS
jgi:uncharacterized membrane protein HdeD (DUF308 family)